MDNESVGNHRREAMQNGPDKLGRRHAAVLINYQLEDWRDHVGRQHSQMKRQAFAKAIVRDVSALAGGFHFETKEATIGLLNAAVDNWTFDSIAHLEKGLERLRDGVAAAG